jgi:hypothetical protein
VQKLRYSSKAVKQNLIYLKDAFLMPPPKMPSDPLQAGRYKRSDLFPAGEMPLFD